MLHAWGERIPATHHFYSIFVLQGTRRMIRISTADEAATELVVSYVLRYDMSSVIDSK